jgi:steroid 5-alpha reductase family enzyme
MAFFETYLTVGLAIWGLMTLLWLISLWLRDASIVDSYWGTGFVVAAWVYFLLTPAGFSTRKWLVVLLVTLWGLRLSLHILRRNWGRGEDFRYQAWRQEHGPAWWWRSYLQVYMLQGALMWIISLPLLAAQFNAASDSLTWLDGLALPVWCVGFFFEAAGDQQLARFKADPANKGRVLNTGVWRYTRHPNYFGDAVQWWAYYLLAAAAGGFWTILSPLVMTFLLVRVSGVSLLEKTLKDAKSGYREYTESTSAFIPWFPRPTPPKDSK